MISLLNGIAINFPYYPILMHPFFLGMNTSTLLTPSGDSIFSNQFGNKWWTATRKEDLSIEEIVHIFKLVVFANKFATIKIVYCIWITLKCEISYKLIRFILYSMNIEYPNSWNRCDWPQNV